MLRPRKHLSVKGLLDIVHHKFSKITPPRAIVKRSTNPIELVDCLMSGLAVFSMKFPSLLQFEEQSGHKIIKHNLKTLYQIDQVPSDTYLRERLDEVDPRELRKIFKTIFSHVQRGKVLEDYAYFDGHYLMPMDMTGFFSSPTINCENCCVKQNNKPKIKILDETPKEVKDYKANTYLLCGNLYTPWELIYIGEDEEKFSIELAKFLPEVKRQLVGKARRHLFAYDLKTIKKRIYDYHESEFGRNVTHYHNMMCAAIVHPDIKVVLPFAPEPVRKTDGASKNDCELNAAKRLIADIRREHPHLKLIAVQDAIGANSLNLLELKFADIRYIVGVKPDNHKELFNLVNNTPCRELSHETDDGKKHRYRYINEVPLNSSGFEINFLEYWETDKKGNVKHFSWVTDIRINNENVYQLMKGGRANWQIENNTFNTLKNQGYHFSHNFGHGYKHLCTIFGMLMMLAFFIDQVQEHCCELFKKARKQFRTRIGLWTKMKNLFSSYFIANWTNLFNAIADDYQAIELIPNTS